MEFDGATSMQDAINQGLAILTSKKKSVELPKNGNKFTSFGNEYAIKKHIETSRNALYETISLPVSEYQGDIIQGTWIEELKKVHVKVRGKLPHHFGITDGIGGFLFPEEALFLLFKGVLTIMRNGVPLDLAEAYIHLNKDEYSIKCSMVYNYLVANGYKVRRHTDDNFPKQTNDSEFSNSDEEITEKCDRKHQKFFETTFNVTANNRTLLNKTYTGDHQLKRQEILNELRTNEPSITDISYNRPVLIDHEIATQVTSWSEYKYRLQEKIAKVPNESIWNGQTKPLSKFSFIDPDFRIDSCSLSKMKGFTKRKHVEGLYDLYAPNLKFKLGRKPSARLIVLRGDINETKDFLHSTSDIPTMLAVFRGTEFRIHSFQTVDAVPHDCF